MSDSTQLGGATAPITPHTAGISDAASRSDLATPYGPWDRSGPLPFRLRGDDLQTVEFLLQPDQHLMCEPHAFVCARGGITGINVTWGRLLDPLLRRWAGEAAILQDIQCHARPGTVVLGAPRLGRIVRLPVTPGHGILCQRGAYMASTGDIHLSVAFTRRLSAGLFGGQGIVFQHLTGNGDVFLHGMGSVIDWTVGTNESIRVSTHHLLAFEESVGYEIQFAGGPATLLAGGQGLFLSLLHGPGRVIVQSVDPNAIAAYRRGSMRSAGAPASHGLSSRSSAQNEQTISDT